MTAHEAGRACSSTPGRYPDPFTTLEQTVSITPNPDPTDVWIDGDPLMEAIAAAVWERCGRDDVDMPQLTMDDPRTIAAAAASVARQQAAVSVVPPATNQTAPRCGVCQRVDDGSHPAVCFPPAPVDRAAVLRWAADELGRMDYDTDSNDYGYDTYRDAWNGGVMDGADLLRRLAAESAVVPPPAPRCPAAHVDDPAPCDGPVVVTVLDAMNAGAHGCEHHAARLLASLDGGRVYPLPDAPDGAAIRVFKAAGTLRPFCWAERGDPA